ncbi:hypothetical protein R1flu_021801 [Riccia fluitans]|uniref:Uncharacterized protein n=1 Tax=Riccia fluitans TaxID=41844 RepID=A0ABD1ZQL8_9MARC
MDVHLHGACMGKLVGPAGGGGGGGGAGHGVSAQFRVLPNGLPSDFISTDGDRIHTANHFPSLTLRVAAPTPHRTFSPEPLKISDEFISSASTSPAQDAANGFLVHDHASKTTTVLKFVVPLAPLYSVKWNRKSV